MKPQNLLFLFSDQHSRKALGCYGHPLVKTPYLDQLASEGTLLKMLTAILQFVCLQEERWQQEDMFLRPVIGIMRRLMRDLCLLGIIG